MYLANMCAKVLGGLNPGMASCSEHQRRYRSSRTANCSSGEEHTPRPGNHPGSAVCMGTSESGASSLRLDAPDSSSLEMVKGTRTTSRPRLVDLGC